MPFIQGAAVGISDGLFDSNDSIYPESIGELSQKHLEWQSKRIMLYQHSEI